MLYLIQVWLLLSFFCFRGGSTSQSGKKQTSTIILTPPPGVATNLVGVSCESCYGMSMHQPNLALHGKCLTLAFSNRSFVAHLEVEA